MTVSTMTQMSDLHTTTVNSTVVGNENRPNHASSAETSGRGGRERCQTPISVKVAASALSDRDVGVSAALDSLVVEPVPRLVGHLAVPGDKSISHRAVLIGAICDGETRITGFGRSADTEATIGAVRALGIDVYEHGAETLRVFGRGPPRSRRRRHDRSTAPTPGRSCA